MSDKNHPNFVVLTGAGFSKPFGVPLASEINTKLRHIFLSSKNNDILERISSENNFEKIYSDLQEEKSDNFYKFTEAIQNIFEKINDDCRQAGKRCEIFKLSLQRFIEDYFYDSSEFNALHFFTLNQDILLENLLQLREGPWGGLELIYPGICYICGQRPTDYQYEPNNDETKILSKNGILNMEINQKDKFFERFDQQKNQRAIVYDNQVVHRIYYYKLHGSSNWIDQDNRMMVMGCDKPNQISRNNLLSIYFDLFETEIQGKNLFIIGYSFNDPHVNSIISKAVKKSGTKIYYLSPDAKPDNKKLSDIVRASDLFPYALEKILDYNPRESGTMPPEMQDVRRALQFRVIGQNGMR